MTVFDNTETQVVSDYVDGGAGNDTAWGGDGTDTLLGDSGNDASTASARRPTRWRFRRRYAQRRRRR